MSEWLTSDLAQAGSDNVADSVVEKMLNLNFKIFKQK